jgi:diguanylate cyclase (GGDEF)-like protein
VRPARIPRLSLLGRFSALSLILIVALGLAVGGALHQRVERRSVAEAKRLATASAQVAALSTVRAADLRGPVAGARLPEFDHSLGAALHAIGAIRVKLYNDRGVVVYSDDHAALGEHADDDDIAEALSGEHLSDVTRGTDDTGKGPEALESYVPLRLAGSPRINGVLELYLPYAPVRAAIASDTRTLVLLLAAGLLILWAALFRIVQRASRRLRHMALRDDLTGLANRARLQERGRALLEAAPRENEITALLLVDLDRFREVNDTLGHDQGDALLRHAAARLGDALRPDDLLARVGADVFAILCPGLPHRSTAAEIAGRLHDALGRPFDLAGVAIELEASIGIALSPDHGREIGVLLREADVAMGLAKQDRTRTETYDRSRDGHSADRLALLGELRRALVQDELVLHFQPKVGVEAGAVTGVEALIRWQHPERGLLGPGEFMPLAVRTGLVGPLTRWVLDTALAQAAAWRARGIELSVAVNLAPPNVLDVRLPDLVAELLGRHGVPPRLLICEISEDTVLADPQRTITSVRRLRSMGVGLALDDFGAGQTSLAYLKQLPLDEIKIDRSFVAGMLSDVHDRAIVGAAITLGRDLGLRVVAEGVEDGKILRDLADRRCDAVQGFFFSRALPAGELESWLDARAALPGA